MRKLAGSLVIVAVSTLAMPAAQADTPGCVSHKEFRRIDMGDSRHRVNHVFDTSGDLIADHGRRTEYAYDTCGAAVVFVEYANDRVTSTQWVRGE
jgi:hypothetical protein